MNTGSVHKQFALQLQLMKTPQGGRFWFKPEINWHHNEITDGTTQQLEGKKKIN